MTAIPTLTALPTPPQRGQDAAVFIQRADVFIDALTDFVTELNAFGPDLIDATAERVVDEAGVSFAGAAAARDAAIAARNAAQGYAAGIDPANIVHRTADESVDGVKTFVKKITATLGVRINGQDLTDLTAAGKALIEAADLGAQKTLLGVREWTQIGVINSTSGGYQTFSNIPESYQELMLIGENVTTSSYFYGGVAGSNGVWSEMVFSIDVLDGNCGIHIPRYRAPVGIAVPGAADDTTTNPVRSKAWAVNDRVTSIRLGSGATFTAGTIRLLGK